MSSYLIYTGKLKGEYKAFFEAVENYGIMKNVEGLQMEDAMSSLLDTLLTAQEKGESVESVCGNDVDAFCKEYFGEQNAVKNYMVRIPETLYYLSLGLLLFGLLDLSCVEHLRDIFTVTSDLSGMFIGYLISLAVTGILCVLMKLFDRNQKIKWWQFGIIDLILCIAIMTTWVLKFHAEWKFPTLYLMGVTLIYTVGFKAHQLYRRYQRNGSIFKTEEEKALSPLRVFRDTLNETSRGGEMEREYLKNQLKIYKKKHEKTGITEEEYDVKLDKETYWMEMENKYMWVLFVVLVGVAVLTTGRGSTLWDTVLFGVILCVIEFGVYKSIMTMMKSAVEMRKTVSERAKSMEMTTIGYAREQLGDENK